MALENTTGYWNSRDTAIDVLTKDIANFDASGLIAKAGVYRHILTEIDVPDPKPEAVVWRITRDNGYSRLTDDPTELEVWPEDWGWTITPLYTAPNPAPDFYAIHSVTGSHIGLWPKKEDAEQVALEYEGCTITPLYASPRPETIASGAMVAAAKDIIASRSDTYTARNGRRMGIQDESGEKMWLVPFDEMLALEAALSPQEGE